MENQEFVLTPEQQEIEKGLKVLELRQAGYTWRECDEILFPEVPRAARDKMAMCPSAKLAKKYDLPAFEKRVYGAFTAHQVVEKREAFPTRAKPAKEKLPEIAADVALAGLMG